MPYPATPTVWLEPTDQVAIGLRRYTNSAGADSLGCETGYHSALIYIGRADAVWRDTEHGKVLGTPAATPHADPRWPTACTKCGHEFGDQGHWQDWQELLYRRADTGKLVTLRTLPGDGDAPSPAPPGAMWDAWWMPERFRGPDGIALTVRLPNGHDWMVDAEASNCTRPGDRTHRCWVRRGDPRTEPVHVDKDGDTCAAGAGSIQAADYHGFLHHGVLTAG